MKPLWSSKRLGEVLRHRKEFVTIDDLAVYRRPRVQLHAKGIVLRDEVPGALVKTKQQQVCRRGELLVAEIDAKVGGVGIVPNALDGALVSSHYFLFEIDETMLDLGIEIPMPHIARQKQGEALLAQTRAFRRLQREIGVELDALLPAILDRAFKGEL